MKQLRRLVAPRTLPVMLLLLCCSAPLLAAVPAQPAGDKGETLRVRKEAPHYALEVREPTARTGMKQQAELRLVGRGGYKVNVEYPTRIKLKAPAGIMLETDAVGKADALELTKEVARFPLRYLPARPGSAELQAEVRFSVCNDKQCDLAMETLTWIVKVD
ncbi:MAG: hypothetical protein FJ125_12610 [Deltaproteobacteria bacterium]|nr:hypothetical protein [Deltaproteobacteria bacterium]